MHDVAKNIKLLRKERGLNQAQLAEKMHVTRQAVSSWERGLSSPDLHTLVELAKIFEVDVNQIIYASPNGQKKSKRTAALSPKFILWSLLLYFFLFYFGGTYLGIPLFKRICGGGIAEEFIYMIYWGLILLVGYIAICTCLIVEYILYPNEEVGSVSEDDDHTDSVHRE